jgi:ABC-type polysaccharide/polyol phosphate transport system ATPase subunit
MTYVVEFDQVSKKYHLGGLRGSLREAIPNLARRLLRRGTPRPELWALRDVSFRVSPGEALGIIGPNGAGKTTALKLATFVTRPTSGRIDTRGRASALIELGAGFHPDLTGRENIYLNGTILGLKRHEIKQRFDEIVAFSELEQFLDTPVKRYSSGMYARLGFSVAAHVNPDILIIDEVLAVGDVAFVAKCWQRMRDLQASGTTIVVVTHHLSMMRRLCNRALLLFRGEIVAEGSPQDVVATYLDNPEYSSNLRSPGAPTTGVEPRREQSVGSKLAEITQVQFLNRDRQVVTRCRSGDPLIIRVEYIARKPIERPTFEFKLFGADGTRYADHNTGWDHVDTGTIRGPGAVEIVIDDVVLPPGFYDLSLQISDAGGLAKFDWHHRRYRLHVVTGRPGSGLVNLPHSWRFLPARGESTKQGPPTNPDPDNGSNNPTSSTVGDPNQ